MKQAPSFLLATVFCAAALAQDDPAKKPDPAPPADPAAAPKPDAKPEAKKERKVDPAAMKALDRYAGLLHIPATSGFKDVSAKGDFEQNGMTFGINPKWNPEKGFDFDVTAPEEVIEGAKKQGATEQMVNAQLKGQLGQLVAYTGIDASFERPGKNWVHYDVASKQEGDDQVVELTAFDDKADAASRTYVFGKDGLLKKSSKTPKDGDPMAQQLGGMPLEVEWKFEKKGERYVLAQRTIALAQLESSFTYFVDPSGMVLLKESTLVTPQGDRVVTFHDYVVDGKPVESTTTKAEPAKPAEKPKDAAKPADPAPDKPAEKPVDNPPPAPKQDGK